MSATASDLLLQDADQAQGLGGPTADIAARSPLQLFWRRLRQDKVALAALGFIVALVIVAVLAPLIVKLVGAHPPDQQNPNALDQFGSASGPSVSRHYLFGTDGLGRDVFSRVLYGAIVSLKVAVIATGIGVTAGIVMGTVAGFYRGWVDTILARVMDVLLSFPVLLFGLGLGAACSLKGCIPINRGIAEIVLVVLGLVLALVGVLRARANARGGQPLRGRDYGGPAAFGIGLVLIAIVLRVVLGTGKAATIQPGLNVVIFIIALSNFPYVARIIRGQVLSLREKEFVDAARALGAPNGRIIFREILPNLVAPIIVYTTLIIPTNILYEAALSFLGVGVEPPQASWGSMIADAIDIFDTAWWFMLFPGLALLLTVLAFNLLGDGLQDALNPRSDR